MRSSWAWLAAAVTWVDGSRGGGGKHADSADAGAPTVRLQQLPTPFITRATNMRRHAGVCFCQTVLFAGLMLADAQLVELAQFELASG